jgi:hypothetical protein
VPPFAAHAALCWGVQQKRIEDVAVTSVTLPAIAALAANTMTAIRSLRCCIALSSWMFGLDCGSYAWTGRGSKHPSDSEIVQPKKNNGFRASDIRSPGLGSGKARKGELSFRRRVAEGLFEGF